MKITRFLLFISFCFGQILMLKAQTTIVLRPNAANGKDAYIDSRVSSNNYGNHIDFPAIAWTNGGTPTTVRGLIDFDLSSIPDGATINSATLSLYSYNSPANGSHSKLSGSNAAVIKRVTSSWSESTVTWNTQPSTTTLNQVSLPASTASIQNYYPNVTAMVQDMINNRSGSFGFLIKLVTEQYYRRLIFASSDNSNPALHPQLTITYTLPVSACVTLRPNADNGKDAYIDSRVSSNNYGNHIDFPAIAWTNGGTPTTVRGLIDFDLSSIPDGATINSAQLSLYSYNSPANGSHSPLSGSNASVLQRITSSWDEGSVTWNSQPSSTSLNQVALPASTASIQNYYLDVTTLTQDMVNDRSNSYGFLIKLVTEQYYRRLIFASSDNPDASLHPQLDICYTTNSFARTMPFSNTQSIGQAKNVVKTEVSVFPNPVRNGIINLSANIAESNLTRLNIYTTRGKLVKSIDVKDNKLKSINLGNTVPASLYFIKVYSLKGEVHSQRLVVE